ncbi:hypothetical protein Pla22_18420 [Rubripirellula amarantea]|uniref:Uncharacterized protein n=1 Tax=Rubripirellula amarantea TaxID=2527999 RepID=A0A5C5WU25_9BACT|nr:hypothetical protein [Rubripirellula amarantea]TWT54207.1 hypothetical protein Pla22_18420 [Rubripirellula amarantea]
MTRLLPLSGTVTFASVALCFVSLNVIAVEPRVSTRTRIISAGWNQPTLDQLARDQNELPKLPIDGSVVSIRTETNPPDLFSVAHSASPWDASVFESATEILETVHPKIAAQCYLGLNANPGDVDFFDDEGWKQVTEHWRIAARLVANGKLRGIAFDPEAYTLPHSQFQYSAQASAASYSFQDYAAAARQRGRQVITAVNKESPNIEILSYFLMSFLVNDRLMMGPSPVNSAGQRRDDFQWCLAGHQYGLLPAFLAGLLEASDDSVTFFDGCEFGYWMESRSQMIEHARQVRVSGCNIIEPEVRSKYQSKVRLAFPIFMDLVTADAIPHWTLNPAETDRLKVLTNQVRWAQQSSDGLVWIYSERGRWWPEATSTALWNGKDVFRDWQEVLPGCNDAITTALQASQELVQDRTDDQATASEPALNLPSNEDAIEVTPLNDLAWKAVIANSDATSDGSTTNARIEIANQQVSIVGPVGGAATATASVKAGMHYSVKSQITQTGRGMPRLMVQFQSEDGEPISNKRQLPTQPSGDLFYAYPEDGTPSESRRCILRFQPPADAASAIIFCLVTDAVTADDKVTFEFLNQ